MGHVGAVWPVEGFLHFKLHLNILGICLDLIKQNSDFKMFYSLKTEQNTDRQSTWLFHIHILCQTGCCQV